MPEEETEETTPDTEEKGILHALIGHEGAKVIIRSAIRSGDVDIMLEGPPGSGKSVALLAIEEHLPGAVYKDACGFTERKLRDTLSENPHILLMDEIDAAKDGTYEALSMPMEQGRVTKDTSHENYDVKVDTQIFAACNDADDLPQHIRDRFRIITFEEYSVEEYLSVCERLLPRVVDWIDTARAAREVGQVVHEITGTRSVRDARDVARLATGIERVHDVARALDDPTADVDGQPLTPSEVEELTGTSDRTKSEEVILRNMPEEMEKEEFEEIVETFHDSIITDAAAEESAEQQEEQEQEVTAEQMMEQVPDEIEGYGRYSELAEKQGNVEVWVDPEHAELADVPEEEGGLETKSLGESVTIHHSEDDADNVHRARARVHGTPPSNMWGPPASKAGAEWFDEEEWRSSLPGLEWRAGKYGLNRSSLGDPFEISTDGVTFRELVDAISEEAEDKVVITSTGWPEL